MFKIKDLHPSDIYISFYIPYFTRSDVLNEIGNCDLNFT